jgi:hypothetical protein
MIAMPMMRTDDELDSAAVVSPGGAAGALQPGAADAAPKGAQAPILSTALLAFGAVVMMLMIFRMLKGTTRARHSRDHLHETPRETIDRHRAQAISAREPLNTMMAEADELAHRLAKLLDNKAARIEALIADADRRIAALERGAGVAAEAGADGPRMRISADSVEDRVFALSDEGCDSMQIARRVGRSVGEVDLILALRRS